MATLKDVTFSQSEEKVQEKTVTNLVSVDREIPPIVPQSYVIFKLKNKRNGKVNIDGISEAVNPKTNRRERIYLLSGADSIWQSELKNLLSDKDYMRTSRRSLVFDGGICRVPLHDERMLEFARVNNNNMGVPKRVPNGKWDFYEYDPEAEQKERHQKQMLKINMVLKANELRAEKMKKIAWFLGVKHVDDLGLPKSDKSIRTDLLLLVEQDPQTFEKYVDSEEVEISYLVKRAIIDAKIDLTLQQGNAVWASGKGFITKIPAARKTDEYLTELAMTNSNEGREFLEKLKSISN
jgi:hypothetical protein